MDAAFDALIHASPADNAGLSEWLDQELAKEGCYFGKQVIPSFLKPYFLSEKETRELQDVSHTLTGMLEKIIQGYFRYPQIQAIFDLSKEERKYIEMDPGYSRSIVISWPDGFLVDGHMKFIEFNCDSPAGSGFSDVQERILRRSPLMKQLGKKASWGRIHRLEGLLQALLRCAWEFGTPKVPHIAIVDWKGVKTHPEFLLTQAYFESKGYKTLIADPRELKYRSAKLYCGPERIDLIYRRVIFKELWEKRDEVQDFLKAYRLGKVCVVNPFRSRLAANKSVLSILTSPMHDYLFTKREIDVRDKHIPWTRRVIDAEKFYGGQTHRLSNLVEDYQQKLVLKPAEGYGGRDVKIGCETSKAEWKRTIDKALRGAERWVVQDYVPIPEMKVPVLHKKKLRLVSKKVNLNPFVFGGRYVGSMARLSDQSVINVSAGGGLIPAVKYGRRK